MTDHLSSDAYFARTASQWDRLRAGFFSEAVRSTALENAYLRPEMTAADIGAGTGFLAEELADRVAHLHLVDASEAMLAEARKKFAGRENVSFHQADGRSIPLADGSMDVVFANMYLHHCPDPRAALAEMVRLLRPGGRLVLTDLDEHAHAWLREEMADVWLGFPRDQVFGWLREAGLVNLQAKSTGQDCTSLPEDSQAGEARIGVFLAAGTKRMARQESVSAHYAAHAENGTSCCGSPQEQRYELALDAASTGCCGSGADCCSPAESTVLSLGYSQAEQALAPVEASEFSLGCGNPLAMAALRAGEVVVDIGSGGGFDAFVASRKVGPQGRVIGVDPTPAMLARARRTAARHDYHNVEFRQGQADSLPVDDDSVDVVISNCVINLVEDKGAVFSEAYRVLRPGGRLEVSDVVAAGPLPLAAREDEDSWAGCVSGALPESEYLDLIRQAGFEQVQAVPAISSGELAGVPVYSATVRAVKPLPLA